MAIPTFFHADLTPNDQHIVLSPSESQHARSARRLQCGQSIRLLNGQGLVASAEITVLERHRVCVSINGLEQKEPPRTYISIYSAVPKSDRQRFFVESLTQLGVGKIVPLRCEYSASSAHGKTLEKWQRYSIEAAKQSQNPWLPEISKEQDLLSLPLFDESCVWFADASGVYFAESFNANARPDSATIGSHQAVFIGPEGGFSETEIAAFKNHGYLPVKLAPQILRTETAAIVAVAQLRSLMIRAQ